MRMALVHWNCSFIVSNGGKISLAFGVVVVDEWMNGWMHGWIDEWMDGWMDELMNEEGRKSTGFRV